MIACRHWESGSATPDRADKPNRLARVVRSLDRFISHYKTSSQDLRAWDDFFRRAAIRQMDIAIAKRRPTDSFGNFASRP
jgi:hypothetical protein